MHGILSEIYVPSHSLVTESYRWFMRDCMRYILFISCEFGRAQIKHDGREKKFYDNMISSKIPVLPNHVSSSTAKMPILRYYVLAAASFLTIKFNPSLDINRTRTKSFPPFSPPQCQIILGVGGDWRMAIECSFVGYEGQKCHFQGIMWYLRGQVQLGHDLSR